jgi:hypothetical protein
MFPELYTYLRPSAVGFIAVTAGIAIRASIVVTKGLN